MPISVITSMSSFGAFGIWPPALCFDVGGLDYFSLIEKKDWLSCKEPIIDNYSPTPIKEVLFNV